MDYFAILVRAQIPAVIAHASNPEEMVDLLRGCKELDYLSITGTNEKRVLAACTRASIDSMGALCSIPLFGFDRLFIQARR